MDKIYCPVWIHCRPFVNAANFEPRLGNSDERNFSLFAPLQYVTNRKGSNNELNTWVEKVGKWNGPQVKENGE